MDEIRISPAGDGFYAAAKHRPDTEETPHGCYEGYVYLGFETEDDGELVVEVTDRVPCRRCEDEHARWLAEADRINEYEMWGPRGRPSR